MKRDPKSAKLIVLDNDESISAETEAIQSRIRQRAFELSTARPHDAQELYDWITAESEIISVPPAELLEKDGTFEVRFAVAGVDPNDVNLMVTRNQVALKSSYRHEHDNDSCRVHLCDFSSATVFRSVTLPEPIDVNTVKANFNHGILSLSAVKEAAAASHTSRSRRTATSDKKPTARKNRTKLS